MINLPYLHLALTMQEEPRKPVWPTDVAIGAFFEEYAQRTHALLVNSYMNGGGSVADFETWHRGLISDSEYDPDFVVPVLDRSDRVIAFVQCWNSAFIKDLVVDPDRRREGIGEALLLHVLGLFFHRGQHKVSLKVEPNNPSGAERLYRRIGFDDVLSA
ncbi:GNAT family N-acetyltransferase [Ochrobactrum quorumnocens]|nr:GNAT family N-acetyltransferase [[Ochrobactrum] quorumnocens]